MACATNGNLPLPDTETMSPFVKASFGGLITVGNKSSPGTNPKHEAVIKSFEFGYSNGAECEIEILDEQGGMFEETLLKLCKNYEEMTTTFQFWVRWGWIGALCPDGDASLSAGPIYFVAFSIAVTYDGGKIKFKIKGKDATASQAAARNSPIWGTDSNRMPLKEALEKLWKAHDPVTKVLFKSWTGVGSFDWKNDPKSVWQGDNQNRLAVTHKWTEDFITTNDRGTYVINDHTASSPTIWIVESDTKPCIPTDKEDPDLYVVYGGRKSNVLTFSPNINFPTAWEVQKAAGGFSGTPMSSRQKRLEKCPGDEPDHEYVGIQASQSISRASIHTWGTKAAEELEKTHRAQHLANAKIQGPNPVTAELKIHGSTKEKFWQPQFVGGKPIHIVVINPFHIRGGGNGDCGDWLAEPMCNASLTSKEWVIQSVSHSIKEGTFTTTMKIYLPPKNEGGGGDSGGGNLWAQPRLGK